MILKPLIIKRLNMTFRYIIYMIYFYIYQRLGLLPI